MSDLFFMGVTFAGEPHIHADAGENITASGHMGVTYLGEPFTWAGFGVTFVTGNLVAGVCGVYGDGSVYCDGELYCGFDVGSRACALVDLEAKGRYLSIRVTHNDGSLFLLDTIRPYVKVIPNADLCCSFSK